MSVGFEPPLLWPFVVAEEKLVVPPFVGDDVAAVSVVSKVGDRVTPNSKVEFIMGTFIGV